MTCDQYANDLFHDYGIGCYDKGSFTGYIKSSCWELWFPRLDDDGHIISLMRKDCDRLQFHYISDVKRFIKKDQKTRPQYYGALWAEMHILDGV